MVQAEGMGLAPWGAIGRGMLKKPEEYDDPNRDGRKMVAKQPDKYITISKKLDEIAQRKDSIITSIALAYVMHKAPYVFPIVGGRKVSHLEGNIAGLGVELSDDEIKEIDDAEPFDVGFPTSFVSISKGVAAVASAWLARSLSETTCFLRLVRDIC